MIKYFNIILFFILFNIILSEKLSLESANQIVTNLIIDKDSDSSISDISELVLYPNLYFVNLSPSGFVIISKEDRAMPVLGYSFNNSIDIEYLSGTSYKGHYELTPYSFKPKIAKKYTLREYHDLGQGLLECIYHIYDSLKDQELKVRLDK